MKRKIWGVIAAAALILVIALTVRGCKPDKVVDTYKEQVEQLKDSIVKFKDKEMKDSVEFAHLSVEYNKASVRADSLGKKTTKTIVRYREVRAKTDTVLIIQAADSLLANSELLAQEVPILRSKADSLIKKGEEYRETIKASSEAYKTLSEVHENEVKELQQQVKKWKKLADRRGRAIEW
jgi:uncharacterized protein Yka (UPF0111/DUF47 family)